VSSDRGSDDRDVRFSRTIGLWQAVAIGASVSVGLGVFTLLGPYVQAAGRQTVGVPYLVMAIFAIPLVLAYVERASVIPGGPLGIAMAGGMPWTTYTTGWLTLGGYACLTTLFGWGLALNLNILVEFVFQASLDLALLAIAIIGLLALNRVIGIREIRQSKGRAVIVSILFLGLILVADILIKPPPAESGRWLRDTDQVLGLATLMLSGLWGLNFIANARDQVVHPTRSIWQSMGLTVLLGCGLGVLAAGSVYQAADLTSSLTPLVAPESSSDPVLSGLGIILYAVAGVVVTFAGLNWSMVNSQRMMSAMIREGFFPEEWGRHSDRLKAPVMPLVVAAIAAALLLSRIAIINIAGVASLMLLWAMVATLLPDALASEPHLPQNRRLKLPFHPLFPLLAIATALLLPFTTSHIGWGLGAAWLAAGFILYFARARRSGLAVRRADIVVGETEVEEGPDKTGYRVMVGVEEPDTADTLIESGIRLAEAENGQLLVLRVLTVPPHETVQRARRIAQEEWESLKAQIGRTDARDVVITPMVRMAPSATSGILEAVEDEQIDLLVLGWSGRDLSDESRPDPVLGPVVRDAACDVIMIRGTPPSSFRRILVPTAGGPNAPLGLQLAQHWVDPEEGQISLLHIVTGPLTAESEAEAQAHISDTLEAAGGEVDVERRVIRASSVKEGILAEADDHDLILLGASRDTFLQRSYFGGPPAEVAQESSTPTILVRSSEVATRSSLVQAWSAVSDALPALTQDRREEVYANMQQAAEPTVDFFVLITLSAIIAALGLLQNSAAVIIGAMLVAPLMSPILAMAMGLVRGNLQMLAVAAEATVKGVALAIFVGAIVTIISPFDAPTSEILGRTHPNILDLLVALASGAAAGYAISRKEVAAAMPGVAIAAALVPPLCVAGYGIGVSDLDIAVGASLLFTTNLIAIVFSAALTFLALGFHPERAERGELIRGLKISVGSLVVISVVLAAATIVTMAADQRWVKVESVFNQEMIAQAVRVEGTTITRSGHGYHIESTVLEYEDSELTPEEIAQVESELSEAVGGPVTVDLTVITASRAELAGADLHRQVEILFEEEMAKHSGEVVKLDVEQQGDEFLLRAGVIAYQDHTLDESVLEDVRRTIEETVDAAVRIQAIFLSGREVEIGPTLTPEPVT
jgi:uncharacterized hydrophobic protein (TIGR00271 family)